MSEVTTQINIKEQDDVKVRIKRNIRDKKNIRCILYYFIKRAIDIFAGIVGIIILIPLIVIVWIINKINKEEGPIFYTHTRVGKNGKTFKLHKFRTMIIDADKKLEQMLSEDEELRKEWEQNRKLKHDPRITKSGRILRKTSLDEFPNFIDVLTGKISLIGPRAVVPNELEKFGKHKDEILKVKPGITGYWAANGRSNTTYEERVEMELYYAQNASLLLDIKILFRTLVSVVKKERRTIK